MRGGAFSNADVVSASSDALPAVYMEHGRAFMRITVSDADIDGNWLPKYRAEDRPATRLDQLERPSAVGLTSTDVVWKHYNFAVYGGVEPNDNRA
jgi:tRNA (cmo5U34)-methyltransferase